MAGATPQSPAPLTITNEMLVRWAKADNSDPSDHSHLGRGGEDELTAMIAGRVVCDVNVRAEVLCSVVEHGDIHIATAGLNLVPSFVSAHGEGLTDRLRKAVKDAAGAATIRGWVEEPFLLAVIRAQAALLA